MSQGERLRQKPGLLTPGSWPCSLQNCKKTALLFTPSAVFRYGSPGKLTQQLLSLNRALCPRVAFTYRLTKWEHLPVSEDLLHRKGGNR